MSSDVGLAVSYDPDPSYDRIQRFRRFFRSRLIGLGISVLVLGGLTYWQYDRVPLRLLITGNAVVLGLWLVVVAVSWWFVRRARKAVATLGEGTALLLDRWGVTVAGRPIAWEQLVGMDVAKGPLGLGPRLRVRDTDGAVVQVPWDQLDTRPASLDSAARAYSRGRFGVDLSGWEA